MQTDYLIIGSGAVGMAFADTLLTESDAHITLVDRRAKPGGHWNDAYSFVTLHQPSAFYGVNSTELGSRRKDDSGPNAGLYELASGAEINTYYDKLMQQRFLPSGRVSYHPMSNYVQDGLDGGGGGGGGGGQIVSILSGSSAPISVRKKTVDSTFISPNVPATHAPQFTVADDVKLVTPNALPQLWLKGLGQSAPQQFCVLGAGKTAMDAVIWLLRNGASPDAISWVVPRDSWLLDRQQTQPGIEFFNHSMGGEADKLAAFAAATSIDDAFLRMEASGQMLRIDPSRTPTMFHYATTSRGEVALLRGITQVIRMGRVKAIEPDALVLDEGRVGMTAGTLYVDCTASAVTYRRNEPVFQGSRILVQLLRAPLAVQSAAITAFVEVHGGDDARKNQLCTPVPFPRDLAGFARATQVSMMNQFQWSQDKALRQWMRESRLDGFSKMVADIDKTDEQKLAVLARLRANATAAMSNFAKLASS